jgi:hypothetical protein
MCTGDLSIDYTDTAVNPTPWHDGQMEWEGEGKQFCGFTGWNQIRNWFRPQDRAELLANRFHIRRYVVARAQIGACQTVFDRDAVIQGPEYESQREVW